MSLTLVVFAVVMLSACATRRNQPPVLSADDLNPVIDQGDVFDPMTGVKAEDPEDGDITEDVVVNGWDETNVDFPGTYTITYTVKDSAGEEDSLTRTVTVRSETNAEPPVISNVQTAQTYYIGSGDFDPKAGVIATDAIDGAIPSSEIEVIGTYFLNQPGTYTIKLRVTNSSGIRAEVSIVLTVVASPIPLELTNEPITIEIWHAMGESNQALLQKYADSFKEIYPNVTVVIPAGVGNYDTLKTNTINAITANDMPNLIQGYPDHVAEYLNGKAVVKLDPYINSTQWGLNGDDDINDIIGSYLEENSQYDAAGTYYSLPFNKSTEVMIFNKTVFDELDIDYPETWQDIIAAAPALKAYGDAQAEAKLLKDNPSATAAEIAAAKKLIVPASYDSTGNAFITFTRQFGGAYTSINFSTFKGQLLWNDNAQTTAAMQFLKDNKHIITLPEYWDQQYASTPFVNEQTFVTIGSSAGIRYNIPATDPTTGEPLFEIGVAPVPYNANYPELKAVIQQGTNISLMDTGSEQEKLASWLFLKHLISLENTIDWAMNTGYLPVRTSAYTSATYQEFLNNPTANQLPISMAANAAYAQSTYMFFDPAFIGSSRARTQVGLALERIMIGDGNIAAALQEAYTEANLGGN